MNEQENSPYAVALGDQLRNVRQQQGLSLQDVEQRSDGRLKASVVGAYERGERSVSVSRLRLLADFYHVPMAQLLPRSSGGTGVAERERAGLRLDLTRLEIMPPVERQLVQRFLTSIQVRRGDYNGRVMTIRHEDLETLGAILDVSADDLRDRLVGATAGATIAGGGPLALDRSPAAWMPRPL